MAKAIKAKDVFDKVSMRDELSVKRRAVDAKKTAKLTFFEKTFKDLTSDEKDDLLKAIAISTGIISE